MKTSQSDYKLFILPKMNQQDQAMQCYNNLLSSQPQVDEATKLASQIKMEDLGKNEARLMSFATAVLKGLKEINFVAIAAATAQLLKDQAVAQIVGWPAVESIREKKNLLALGLTEEEASELSLMKSKARNPTSLTPRRHSFRPQAHAREESPRTNPAAKTPDKGSSSKKK